MTTVTGSVLHGLPGRTKAVLASNVVGAMGTGLVQPFLVLYLSEVRGLSTGSAIVIVAVLAASSVAGAPLSGVVADRLSLRLAAGVSLALSTAGALLFARTGTFGTAAIAAVLAGAGYGGSSTAWASALARTSHGRTRSAALSLNFAAMNLGVGVGGVAAAVLLAQADAGLIELFYVVNAASFVISGVLFLPAAPRAATGGPPAEPAARRGRPARSPVLRDRRLRRVLLCTVVLATAGYGQIEATYPALVSLRELAPATIAVAFAANTAVVVIAAVLGLSTLTRWPRRTLAQAIGAIWAASWVIAALAWSLSGLPAEILVVLSLAVFATGEVLVAPSLQTSVNELADERTSGRYNAAYQFAISTGLVLGPLLSAALVQLGHVPLLLGLLAAGCAVGVLLARRIDRSAGPSSGPSGGPSTSKENEE